MRRKVWSEAYDLRSFQTKTCHYGIKRPFSRDKISNTTRTFLIWIENEQVYFFGHAFSQSINRCFSHNNSQVIDLWLIAFVQKVYSKSSLIRLPLDAHYFLSYLTISRRTTSLIGGIFAITHSVVQSGIHTPMHMYSFQGSSLRRYIGKKVSRTPEGTVTIHKLTYV